MTCCAELSSSLQCAKGVDIDDSANNAKQTPLHWAASRNLVQVADALLSQNPPSDIHKGDSLGYQAIHYAAQAGAAPFIVILFLGITHQCI